MVAFAGWARGEEPLKLDSFDKIDCHVHFRYAGNELAELARVKRFRVINVSTNNFDIAWQAGLARQQRDHFPGTVEHVTAVSYTHLTLPTNREV